MRHPSTTGGPVRAHYETAGGAYARMRERGLAGRVRRREQEAVFELLELRDGERLLDAGCGDGAVARRAAKRGARAVAADFAFPMARAAFDRGVASVNVDLRALSFRPGFDVVAWVGSSEFVEDLPGAAREVARSLRPGGRLVLLFPRRNLSGLALSLYHRTLGIRIFLRSRDEVVAGLAAAGFGPPQAWRRRGAAWVCRVTLADSGGDGPRPGPSDDVAPSARGAAGAPPVTSRPSSSRSAAHSGASSASATARDRSSAFAAPSFSFVAAHRSRSDQYGHAGQVPPAG